MAGCQRRQSLTTYSAYPGHGAVRHVFRILVCVDNIVTVFVQASKSGDRASQGMWCAGGLLELSFASGVQPNSPIPAGTTGDFPKRKHLEKEHPHFPAPSFACVLSTSIHITNTAL